MAEFFEKWRTGLAKTSKTAFGQLAQLFGATQITSETWEDLETLLIQADVGIETTSEILEELRLVVRDQGLIYSEELIEALRNELRTRLDPVPPLEWKSKPLVIIVAGVNGSGKTTTIAKLGHRFRSEGKTMLFGAADTFRAAAVDQLQVWGDRLKVDVIAGAPESDPGSRTVWTLSSSIRQAACIHAST